MTLNNPYVINAVIPAIAGITAFEQLNILC